jgi:hypothetical protein
MAQHLQDSQEEEEEEGVGASAIAVKRVVTETRVPVLKLFDTQSNLEVRGNSKKLEEALSSFLSPSLPLSEHSMEMEVVDWQIKA